MRILIRESIQNSSRHLVFADVCATHHIRLHPPQHINKGAEQFHLNQTKKKPKLNAKLMETTKKIIQSDKRIKHTASDNRRS